nr:hypothetical protein [Tanacetum cinerariifolium]
MLGKLSANFLSEPHTICASGTHEDLGRLEKLERILGDFVPLENLKTGEDFGRLENLLDTMGYFDNLRISLSIPGNEKWKETDERIWTFVNMGLEHWDNYKEASVKTRLKLGNKLFIKVSIPGNEKWKETDERIWTFVNMGLEHWDNYKEASVKTRLKLGNKLFIKVNAKNTEFGRTCISRSWIQLSVDKGNNIYKNYKIDKRDGGLMIYLPK